MRLAEAADYVEIARNDEFIELERKYLQIGSAYIRLYKDRMLHKGPGNAEFTKLADGSWKE